MQNKWLASAAFILAAALISDLGCGTASTILRPPPPPPAIAVALTHSAATAIDTNQAYSLSATVSNDPNNRGVKWTVTCPSGVTACGGMAQATSASGAADTYNAPSSVNTAETLTVAATSVSFPAKSASVQVTVNPTPTLVSSPPPQAGNVGQSFGLDLTQYVQGGTAPFTWSIKSGRLPAGLTLDAAGGTVTGTPTAVAATAVVIVFTCADSGSPPISVNVQISLTINPPLPITISPGSGALPSGTVGVDYKVRRCFREVGCFLVPVFITATGGVQPYMFAWAAVAGSSLPPGLNLDPSAGLISGTPTTAGTYNFLVTVTDSESPPKHASANYTITVAPAPSPSPSPSPSSSP